MAKITSHLSHELGESCEAIRNGQVSSQQGGYLARERYQIAMNAVSIVQRLARGPGTICGTSLRSTDEGSSLVHRAGIGSRAAVLRYNLNSSLAQYLELTPKQISAIGQVMARVTPPTLPH